MGNFIIIEIGGLNIDDEDKGEILFELSDAQVKALYWDIFSLKEYLGNIIGSKINQVTKLIVAQELPKMLDDPEITVIPKDRDEIIRLANIKSAKKRQTELEETIQEMSSSTPVPKGRVN